MRSAYVVALRDIRANVRLFAICAAMAVVPFVAALLPSIANDRANAIAIGAAIIAVTFGCSIAAGLGFSAIARPLAEKRMSFYLSKPVSPAALWIGKATAGVVMSFICFALIALPSFLFARAAWLSMWGSGEAIVIIAAIAIVILFFGAHLLGTAIRSRSPLIALDFALAVATAYTVFAIVRPLFSGGALRLTAAAGAAIVAALVGIAAVAPVWQIANGRSDARRSHLALSRFLWPAVAVVLVLAALYVRWVVALSPSELGSVMNVDQSPAGGAAFVSGTGEHRGDYWSSFIVDSETRDSVRLDGPTWWGSAWSRDGRVAAWMEMTGGIGGILGSRGLGGARPELELYIRRRGAQPEATGIRVTPGVNVLVLSDDGSRAAIISGDTIQVHDLEERRLVVAARGLRARTQHEMFFLSPDRLRIYEYEGRGGTRVRALELDASTRQLAQTFEREITKSLRPLSVSADGSRLLLHGSREIIDGRSGALLARLPEGGEMPRASMLSDGSVVAIVKESGSLRLRTFTPQGAPQRDIVLPRVTNGWIAGELDGGRVIVTASAPGERVTMIVDLASGDLASARRFFGPTDWDSDPRLARYSGTKFVGSDASRRLMVWDARAGTVTRF